MSERDNNMKRVFTAEEVKNIVYGDNSNADVWYNEVHDTNRWTTSNEVLVCMTDEDDKEYFYKLWYNRGATESQEDEFYSQEAEALVKRQSVSLNASTKFVPASEDNYEEVTINNTGINNEIQALEVLGTKDNLVSSKKNITEDELNVALKVFKALTSYDAIIELKAMRQAGIHFINTVKNS